MEYQITKLIDKSIEKKKARLAKSNALSVDSNNPYLAPENKAKHLVNFFNDIELKEYDDVFNNRFVYSLEHKGNKFPIATITKVDFYVSITTINKYLESKIEFTKIIDDNTYAPDWVNNEYLMLILGYFSIRNSLDGEKTTRFLEHTIIGLLIYLTKGDFIRKHPKYFG